MLPPGPGALEINIGIPIMVVLSKSDLVENMLREKEGEHRLNFIQYSLRSLALNYGAGLIYVSQKKQSVNVTILFDYILSVFTGAEFKSKVFYYLKADLSIDQLFIPLGYDSQSLIQQTFPNFSVKDNYETFFAQNEEKRKKAMKQELKCEDWQSFLQNFKQRLGGNYKPVNQLETQSKG